MLTSKSLPFILGSASPRRLELVQRFFDKSQITSMVPSVDESSLMKASTKGITAIAMQLAEHKMDALFRQFDLPPEFIALTADTLVSLGEKKLGKPMDSNEAKTMLNELSGRRHQVVTGFALKVAAGGKVFSRMAYESTDVVFSNLDDEKIDWYLASGEPFDKAGSYGIQGLGASLVKNINGCYYNVMGLPVHRLLAELKSISNQFSPDLTCYQLLPWG